MPNNVTNQITFGPDDASRAAFQHMLHELQADGEPLGSIDFNKLIPMPQELNIECGSRTDKGIKLYKEFLLESTAVSISTLQTSKEMQAAAAASHTEKWDAVKKADPEVWALGEKAYQNIQKHGCPTWYEWSIQHWGTKWNAYQCLPLDEKDDTMEFFTAWSAVPKLVKLLSEKYPGQKVTYRWADEDLGSNVGEIVFKDGVEIEENIPETGSCAAFEMSAELTGMDLAECGLFLTADRSTYEFRDEDDPPPHASKQKKRGRDR